MKIRPERFRRLVAEALDDLPDEFAEWMNNVEVVVERRPPADLQDPCPEDLLGLYEGVPLTEREIMAPNFPDIIFLFQENIEKICSNEQDVKRQIRETVLHEVGHHFGLEEDELDRIEDIWAQE